MLSFEIKELSIASYEKVLSKKRRKSRLCDAITNALATVAWREGVRLRTGRISARRTGELLEGRPDNTHKWLNYGLGVASPRMYLLNRIEQALPGTQWIHTQVLWDCCDLEKPIGENEREWIRRLDPEIQVILKRHGVVCATEKRSHIRSDAIGLKMLENRASFDALACLIIQLRAAHAVGNSEACELLGHACCRMLLLLTPQLSHYNILRPFGEFVERELLPLSSNLGGYFCCFWHNGYHAATDALRLRVSSIAANLNASGKEGAWLQIANDVIGGKYGPFTESVVVKSNLQTICSRLHWLDPFQES